jgi:hypothetical protein
MIICKYVIFYTESHKNLCTIRNKSLEELTDQYKKLIVLHCATATYLKI